MHMHRSAVNTAALFFSDRLTASLAAVSSRSLTLVEAPMGYGKTVAVRETLRKKGARVIWVSVLGRGETAFWRDFCRALARVFPGQTDVVESLARLGYPGDSVRVDAARELLLQLYLDRETVMVLDDIHFLPASVSGGGMGRLCTLLARQGVTNLRVVLISRDTWGGERELLSLKGELAVIGRESFALTPEEIRGYYAACGVILKKKDAAALHKATDGWISALYLYLLRYSADGFFSRPPAVSALLEKEIFARLSPGARELLLALSPLERFTKAQAEFLLGGAEGDASAVLAGLQEKNSFISHDELSGTYALHSLFRQYLQERFAALDAQKQRDIHRRCAAWFTLRQDAFSAIEAYHAAGDYEDALAVLESDMSRNFVTERSLFFVDFFKSCPEDVLARHMGAAFKYAIAAFTTGDFRAFGEQIGWLGKKCAERAAAHGEDDPETKAWRGELELLLSFAAYNDIAAMSRHHRRANELLGRPTKLFGPESPWTLGSPSVLFMFHRESGKLDEELALMDECLPHYYTLAAMHGAGGEHQMRAEALYYRGKFQEAAIACHQAEAMARANGQLSVALCAMFLRARLALANGDYPAAESLIRGMRDAIREKRDFFLLHTVDLCSGFLNAALGRLEDIPDWLLFSAGEENRLYTFAGGYYYIAHGRALLLEGEYAALVGLFAWLLQTGAFAGNALFTLYAHIYTAAARTAMGRQAEAEASLRAALALALPDGLYLPLAVNAAFLPQLKKLGQESALHEGVARILGMAAGLGKARKAIFAECFGENGVPSLTKREAELVRLGLSGMPYREIAAATGLAPSSVKRYFATLYKKLGVNNRAELIARMGAK
ncbi:LuxR family Bacterial regulatory protein [uncultured delta proteobacterium]|uniref:LuxR family Bacterial regulatory protein n=1 Tax=uncultured delta proteobacterium TaxID=34034 RepID=A0A212JNG9_9DELT|nr:LuxR family Bacterial regulatory protein [uncultured delta proteobacterium]